jgi:hypothetical protein
MAGMGYLKEQVTITDVFLHTSKNFGHISFIVDHFIWENNPGVTFDVNNTFSEYQGYSF